jgi:GT2 family glycosyltransferase/glycosyltransferase involved in cell wall biosynthesis
LTDGAGRGQGGPVASIVVPLLDHRAGPEDCLRSLLALLDRTPFEIIVVDARSVQHGWDALAAPPHVQVVRGEGSGGRPAAGNVGAATASGEILVFVHQDVVVYAGWLDALVATITTERTVGQVGSLILDETGQVLDAGGLVQPDGTAQPFGRGLPPDSGFVRAFRDVDYCNGASFAIRAEMFERLGGFDPRYAPAHFEDVDLSFAVRALGLRTVLQPRSQAVQLGQPSTAPDEGGGLQRFRPVNRVEFLLKWRDVLAGLPTADGPAAVWVARAHGRRGMVVVTDSTVPTPDQDSGSRRMSAILAELQDMGFAVHFFGVQPQPDRYVRALEARGITVLENLPDQIRFLSESGPAISAFLLSRPHVANRFLRTVYECAPQAVIAYDTVDLHGLRLKRQSALTSDTDLSRLADHEWLLETTAMRAADVTFVVSTYEQAFLADVVPDVDVRVLSNIHAPVVTNPDPKDRADLLFVGNFRHVPNVDAVTWFVSAVLPLVRASVPDVKVRLVGPYAPAEVQALADDGIEVTGQIPDLAPVYARARVVIAPLRFGAGVKGKVAEALEHGVPVVGTAVAVEGMGLRAGREVAVADDPATMAAAIVTLLRDDQEWSRLAGSGQQVLVERFSAARARAVLDEVFAAAPGERRFPLTTELGSSIGLDRMVPAGVHPTGDEISA